MPTLLPYETAIENTGNLTVGDFWQWAYSDILSNRNRGIFAEFLVAAALGVTTIPRIEWAGVDVRYGDLAIEVKTSAYWQSWPQRRPSSIRFGVAERLAWNEVDNTYAPVATRTADVYVFCLYAEERQEFAVKHILDANFWRFYVLGTDTLRRLLGTQRSIALAVLSKVCQPVEYGELKRKIDQQRFTNGGEKT